jgi:hypothetical protein
MEVIEDLHKDFVIVKLKRKEFDKLLSEKTQR